MAVPYDCQVALILSPLFTSTTVPESTKSAHLSLALRVQQHIDRRVEHQPLTKRTKRQLETSGSIVVISTLSYQSRPLDSSHYIRSYPSSKSQPGIKHLSLDPTLPIDISQNVGRRRCPPADRRGSLQNHVPGLC